MFSHSLHSCKPLLISLAKNSTMAISLSKLLAATITILVTTLDDCVWLVPFVAKRETALCHGSLFVVTLTSMAVLVTETTYLFSSRLPFSETVLQGIGALFCWSLAGYLLYRSLQKGRRRQQQQKLRAQIDQDEETPLVVPSSNQQPCRDQPSDDDISQPWMVVTLTFVGSLDEIMYFPGLLLGHLFTAWELCLGAFLAACIMLLMVLTCLRQCQPLMDCLDRIPLYAVVTVFAVLMTAQLIQEWGSEVSE